MLQKLRDPKKIGAESWIIYDIVKINPALLKKHLPGFSLISTNENDHTAYVEIDTQSFIEQYK